jgi:hypothetical protein
MRPKFGELLTYARPGDAAAIVMSAPAWGQAADNAIPVRSGRSARPHSSEAAVNLLRFCPRT